MCKSPFCLHHHILLLSISSTTPIFRDYTSVKLCLTTTILKGQSRMWLKVADWTFRIMVLSWKSLQCSLKTSSWAWLIFQGCEEIQFFTLTGSSLQLTEFSEWKLKRLLLTLLLLFINTDWRGKEWLSCIQKLGVVLQTIISTWLLICVTCVTTFPVHKLVETESWLIVRSVMITTLKIMTGVLVNVFEKLTPKSISSI